MEHSTAEALAGRFGTPAYVYDLAELRAAHRSLGALLPAGTHLYYSLKANPHVDLVKELVRLGCGCEVTSEGELAVALAAGVCPDRILVGGPAKSLALLGAALDAGVTRLSVESPADLRRASDVAEARGGRFVADLRINADEPVTGMPLAMTGQPSQFGSDASWVLRRPEDFVADRVEITGFHLFMGTNISDSDVLVTQFEVGLKLVGCLSGALGTTCSHVNLGGGFGWPYARWTDAGELTLSRSCIAGVLDRYLPGWSSGEVGVSFESGRYLTARAGTLLTRVLDVKTSKGEVFVVTDVGVNQLGGMSGLRRLPRVVPDVLPVGPVTGRHELAHLVGPLCTPLDRLSRGVELPAVQPGDLLLIPNVGAYGLTASLVGFLGHPIAAELVIDEEEVVSATRLVLERVRLREHTHAG